MPSFPPYLDPQTRQLLHAVLDLPDLALQRFDMAGNQAVFTPIDEAGYRASSFLDSRAQRSSEQEAVVSLSGLLELLPRVIEPRRPVHFLFHIGHCGSTLVSRLLGDFDGLFCLREPPILMQLAQMQRYRLSSRTPPTDALTAAQWRQLFDLAMTLLGRTWGSGSAACVKPMSHANNVMPELLDWHPKNHGVLLYVDLSTHLQSMLQEQRQLETERALAESRMGDYIRITSDRDLRLEQLGPGQRAALVWLVEMFEFQQIVSRDSAAARILPVCFDDFLDDPTRQLIDMARLFGATASPNAIEAVVGGPLMHRYSKAPEHGYDAQTRAAQLAHVATVHAAEIASGQRWAIEQLSRHAAFAGISDQLLYQGGRLRS